MNLEDMLDNHLNAVMQKKWYVRHKDEIDAIDLYQFKFIYIFGCQDLKFNICEFHGDEMANELENCHLHYKDLIESVEIYALHGYLTVEDEAMIDRLNAFLANELLVQ
jgi:hypothetical protein